MSELRGTFACPVCGLETPHGGHSEMDVEIARLARPVFEEMYERIVWRLDLAGQFRVQAWGLKRESGERVFRVEATDADQRRYREDRIEALWVVFRAGWVRGRQHGEALMREVAV